MRPTKGVEILLAEAGLNSLVELRTRLVGAAHSGHLYVTRALITMDQPSINMADVEEMYAHLLDAAGGHLDILCSLGYIEIDAPDTKGGMLLFSAVTKGHLEVVRWFIQDGRSNVNHQVQSGLESALVDPLLGCLRLLFCRAVRQF